MPRSLGGWLSLLAIAALALGGCSEAPDSGAVTVKMFDNNYSPPVIYVPPGATVNFHNLGRNQHHAVALDTSWSTEKDFGTLIMESGDRAAVIFEKEGVYPYFCTFHGSPAGNHGMVGAVVVGDVEYQPAGGEKRIATAEASGVTRHVPAEYARIQQAVDAAEPGDLVLIAPGVYHEAVTVMTPSLVLRGTDRNTVILDGLHQMGNGVLALADGVAVENMTARNYLLNGYYWTGVTGYRGSYLTAYNNGDYGIYAFDSVDGLLEHSYASGSPDAGFYVGQCYPCDALLTDLVAENNGLGYSGTNAGGNLFIASSIWRNNMAGVAPNTLDTELLPPERETTVVANLVVDNNNSEAPTKPLEFPLLGNGIIIAGGVANEVTRNVVADHDGYGIVIVPNVDARFWPATDNRVVDNDVRGNGRADIAETSPGTRANCLADNRAARLAPPRLAITNRCDRPSSLRLGLDLVPALSAGLRIWRANAGDYPSGDYREQAAPAAQKQMPGALEAPVLPAVGIFAGLNFDPEKAELPEGADAVLAGFAALEGPPLSNRLRRATAYLPAMWMTLLLVVGLTHWSAAARQRGRKAWGWMAVMLLVPVLGPALFLTWVGPPGTRRRAFATAVFSLLVVSALIGLDAYLGAGYR